MTIVAIEASSRIASRIAIAAVGRKNGSVGRPAVTLSASVAPTTSNPIRISTLSRCQSPGRKRQIQASSIPTARTASSSQPPKLATSGSGSTEIEGIDLLDVRRRQRRPVADDDLALADRDVDRYDLVGGLGLGRVRELGAERGVRDDQRIDEFRRRASARPRRGPPPSARPADCVAPRPRSRATACAKSRPGPARPRS